jgi:hypothetical protein
MENCCENRPNFGRPTCVTEWGDIVGFVLMPLKDSGPNDFRISKTLTYNSLLGLFYEIDPKDRIYAFPTLENVDYVVADSLVEEGASGRKSFLKKGKITLNAETWDKDGTSVLSKKMAKLRCADWGIGFITSNNMLILKDYSSVFVSPIPVDSQSIDPKFMFKTNTTTQKVMFTLDLDRNFDDGTYYAIPCDELWDPVDEVSKTLDLQNLPSIIDCELSLSTTVTTTATQIAVNDAYRQGARNVNNTDLGNVTGLSASDFLVTNVTDLTTITPSSVVEEPTGNYIISYSAQTSGDKIKVDLVLASTNAVNYNGSITYLIP